MYSCCHDSKFVLNYAYQPCQAYLSLTHPASKPDKADIDDCR
jgi:hypothetical protein